MTGSFEPYLYFAEIPRAEQSKKFVETVTRIGERASVAKHDAVIGNGKTVVLVLSDIDTDIDHKRKLLCKKYSAVNTED